MVDCWVIDAKQRPCMETICKRLNNISLAVGFRTYQNDSVKSDKHRHSIDALSYNKYSLENCDIKKISDAIAYENCKTNVIRDRRHSVCT